MTSASQILTRVQQGIITPEQAEKMLAEQKEQYWSTVVDKSIIHDITQQSSHEKISHKKNNADVNNESFSPRIAVADDITDHTSTKQSSKESAIESVVKQWDVVVSSVLTQLTVARMIGWIGGLMLGIGVIRLVADNWSYWSDIAKTAILIGSMLLSYVLWYVLIQRDITWVGYAMILVWGLIYGANIFLIGQMYNIWGNYHEGLLLWWLWLMPLAYATWLVGMLFLSLVIFWIWLITRLVGIDQMQMIVFYIGAVWLVFLSLGRPHKRYYPQFESTYRFWGMIGVYLSFFLLTVGHWTYLWWSSWLQFHVVLISMILLSVIIKLMTREHSDSEIKNFALIVHAGVLTAVYVLVLGHGPVNSDWFAVVMDALLSAYFIGMIVYSIFLQMPHAHTQSGGMIINLNMAFLVWFIVIQYVNIIGNRLEWSVFFISTGVVLLGTAWLVELWRKRILSQNQS